MTRNDDTTNRCKLYISSRSLTLNMDTGKTVSVSITCAGWPPSPENPENPEEALE